MRKKRKDKAGRGRTIVILFILIPVLGTLLGYIISETLLIPYFASQEGDPVNGDTDTGQSKPSDGNIDADDDSESRPVVAYQRVFDIEGLEVYGIQVGAFSNRENADKAAGQLFEQVKSAIVYKDGLYKVFAMFSFDEAVAREHLDAFREFYPDAHTSKIVRSSIGVSYPETSVDEAEALSDGLRKCRQALIGITNRAASGKDIAADIDAHRLQLVQFSEQLAEFEPKSPLSEYAGEADVLCREMLEVFSYSGQRINDNDSGGRMSPWQVSIKLVVSYIDFIDRISRLI
jgi:hypothetical protein